MDINQAKQYHALIADELNVKNVVCGICETDKGPLDIVYNRELNDFHWELNHKDCTTPTLYELIPKYLLTSTQGTQG